MLAVSVFQASAGVARWRTEPAAYRAAVAQTAVQTAAGSGPIRVAVAPRISACPWALAARIV
jgi:hypothetical protein